MFVFLLEGILNITDWEVWYAALPLPYLAAAGSSRPWTASQEIAKPIFSLHSSSAGWRSLGRSLAICGLTGSCREQTRVQRHRSQGMVTPWSHCLGQLRRKPAEVAKILEDRIVRPQLRVLAAMKHEGRQFQDWPAIFYHAKRCTRSSSSDEHRWVRWVKVYPKTDETLMGVVLYGLGCPPAWNSRSLLVTGQGHYFD